MQGFDYDKAREVLKVPDDYAVAAMFAAVTSATLVGVEPLFVGPGVRTGISILRSERNP